MKKFAMMMLAAVSAVVLGAAEIDVNGAFKVSKPGATLPDGWIVNNGPKPVGKHEIIQKDGKTAVRVVGEKSMYGIAYSKRQEVKPGEKYRLSVDFEGQNTVANVGIFMYNGTPRAYKYLKGDYGVPKKLTGAQTISREITIPETVNNAVPTLMGVTFFIWSPGEGVFSNFKLEKLD